MLYLLQVDLIVAIGILLAFFAVYLVLMVLRLGYLAAVWSVEVAKAHLSGSEPVFGNLISHVTKVAGGPSRGN
jgi:hypothetical protein